MCTDFVPQVTQHIGTSAIMNLLHKLLCGVEEEQVRTRIHAVSASRPMMAVNLHIYEVSAQPMMAVNPKLRADAQCTTASDGSEASCYDNKRDNEWRTIVLPQMQLKKKSIDKIFFALIY